MIAKQKVWSDELGRTLVPDGDERASILVARPGQRVAEKALEGFFNVEEFFTDVQEGLENHKEHTLQASEDESDVNVPLVTLTRLSEPEAKAPKNKRK